MRSAVRDRFFGAPIPTNRTIFLSTHTLVDAEELCDDIAIINHGRLIARGDIQSLKEQTQEFEKLEDVYFKVVKDA